MERAGFGMGSHTMGIKEKKSDSLPKYTVGMRDLPVFQRPREKFLTIGPEAMTTTELLAILLRTGRQGASAIDMAGEVLQSLESGAASLNEASVESLQAIKGIGPDKAVTICAAIELGRRLGQMHVEREYADFGTAQAVAEYIMERLRHLREEHFCGVFLDCRNRLIRWETLSVGGLSGSMAEQRSLFRRALAVNAAAIVLVHNHPSGDPEPSLDDIRLTKVFRKAGVVMGIPILDHIVIGDRTYVSLGDRGLL